MDWIAEVDRFDKLLHSDGVPAVHRMKAVAQYADMLAQADKVRRIFEREAQAANLLPLGWRVVVERQGGCKASAYNRAERGRKQSKQGQHG